MNQQLHMAAHLLGILAYAQREGQGLLGSGELAKRMGASPVVLRRTLTKLQKAGLVETKRGAGGGSSLAQPAAQITLKDAYLALGETRGVIGRMNAPTGDHCGISPVLSVILERHFESAEEALLSRLEQASIESIFGEVQAQLGC